MSCYAVFKGPQCRYVGTARVCDHTIRRCKELGNLANFRGHLSPGNLDLERCPSATVTVYPFSLNEGPKDIAKIERQSAAWAAHIEPWQKGGAPMKPSDDISDARLAELVDLAAKCAEISKQGMRKDIDRDIWKALDELRRRRSVSVTQEEIDDWEDT